MKIRKTNGIAMVAKNNFVCRNWLIDDRSVINFVNVNKYKNEYG